jgi:molybdate transport system substrate-binding protein
MTRSRRRHSSALLMLLIGGSWLGVGCNGGDSGPTPSPGLPSAKPEPLQQTPKPAEDRLVVFAAASLRDAFSVLSADFEQAHPGVEITFNFAGTQELRTQVEHGAAADVFASADLKHMDELMKAGRVTSHVIFARNEPVIVVAKESATRIRDIADLKTSSRLVIGLPDVPVGRYTLQILDKASKTLGADFRSRVEANVASREPNVRQVLAKVSLGEGQAGIVYRTDANAAKAQVAVVAIPPDMNVIAEYPIAVVAGAAHPALARDWVALVASPEGQRALSAAGFLPANAGASP